MSGYESWSTTPGSNANVDGSTDTDIAENSSPAAVNDALRAVLANVAILRDLTGGKIVSGGTADAQTITTGLATSAYQQGLLIGFEAGATLTNTGAMTVNVDAIGTKNVKLQDGTDPYAGAVTAGGIYLLAYESGADVLLLLNPTPRDVLVGTQTFYAPAKAFSPTETNGASRYVAEDATNDLMEESLGFDTSTEEHATFDFKLPKKWDEGTITVTPYWRTTGGGAAETVQWAFAAVAISNDDAADAAPGTEQTSDDTWIADADLHVGPATSAITIAGTPAAGDLIRLKVSRNVASDDLGADARLQGVDISITVDAGNDG